MLLLKRVAHEKVWWTRNPARVLNFKGGMDAAWSVKGVKLLRSFAQVHKNTRETQVWQ